MKILAFADVHGSTTAFNKIDTAIKKYKPDILVCCGDVSIFEQHLDLIIKKIAAFGKQTLVLHGNHESAEIMKKLCARHENIIFMHKKIKEINEITFVGYGGGGFCQTDKEFEKFADAIENKIKGKTAVLLTHGPPHKTKLDKISDEHVGCKSFRKFITKNNNVILAISGHIHETAGKQDRIGNALLINPGPWGRIIEL